MAGTDLKEMNTAKLMFDAEAFEKLNASLLALVEAPDRPLKARLAFGKRLLNLFDKGGAIDFDTLAASGTGELTITPKPSKRLVRLMTAFGAGD